jgi:DNA-binding FadR family transcriptional regulator
MNGERENWGASQGGISVRAPKVADLIAQRLRGQIVRGVIASGEMLPSEKALMSEFAVSRPALREAFRVLESEGLIQILSGAKGGPQARLPDLGVAARHIGLYLQVRGTTLEDLLEARTEFEPRCARLLAQRCTEEGLAAMRLSVKVQEAALAGGLSTATEFSHWVELTAEFHDLIARHCGNRTLGAQSRALRDVFRIHRQIGIEQRARGLPTIPMSEFAPGTVQAYATLADLVEQRDAPGAEAHWRLHLITATELFFRARDRSSTINLFD